MTDNAKNAICTIGKHLGVDSKRTLQEHLDNIAKGFMVVGAVVTIGGLIVSAPAGVVIAGAAVLLSGFGMKFYLTPSELRHICNALRSGANY